MSQNNRSYNNSRGMVRNSPHGIVNSQPNQPYNNFAHPPNPPEEITLVSRNPIFRGDGAVQNSVPPVIQNSASLNRNNFHHNQNNFHHNQNPFTNHVPVPGLGLLGHPPSAVVSPGHILHQQQQHRPRSPANIQNSKNTNTNYTQESKTNIQGRQDRDRHHLNSQGSNASVGAASGQGSEKLTTKSVSSPTGKTAELIQEQSEKMDDFRDPEKLLQLYRSVECQCCQRHLCFQSRTKKDLLYCSVSCLGQGQEGSGIESSGKGLTGVVTPQRPSEILNPIPIPVQTIKPVTPTTPSFVPPINVQKSYPVENGHGDGRFRRTGYEVQSDAGGQAGLNDRRSGGYHSDREGNEQRGGGPFGGRGGQGQGVDRRGSASTDRGVQNFDRGMNDRSGYTDRGYSNSNNVRGGQAGRGGRGSYNGGGRGGYSGGGGRGGNRYNRDQPSNDDGDWIIPEDEATATDVTDASGTRATRDIASNIALARGLGAKSLSGASRLQPEPAQKTNPCPPAEEKEKEPKYVPSPLPEKGTKEYDEMKKVACSPSIETFPKVARDPNAFILPTSFPTVEIEDNKKVSAMSTRLGWANLEIGIQQVLAKSHSNSCTDFYVQTFESEKMSVALIDEIFNYLDKNQVPLKNMEVGSLCLAPFEDTYYRAEIVEVNGNPPIFTVFFCDFGNETKVTGHVLYELPKEFRQLPRCAINCVWDMAASKELAEVELGKVFEAQTITMTPRQKIAEGQYLVGIMAYVPKNKLVIRKNESGGSNKVYQKVEAKPKQVEDRVARNPPIRNESSVTPAPQGSAPTPAPTSAVIPTPAQAPVTPAPDPKESEQKVWTINNCTYSPNIKSGSKVRIAFVWTMQRYLITAVADDKESIFIQEIITNGKYEPLDAMPKIGDILLGMYEGEYYRGYVYDISGDEITMEFMDFGDRAVLKLADLRLPNEKLMKYPIYGMNIILIDAGDEKSTCIHTKELNDAGGGILQVVFEDVPGNDAKAYLWISENKSYNAEIKAFLDAVRSRQAK